MERGEYQTTPNYRGFISRTIMFLYDVSVYRPFALWVALKNFVVMLPTDLKKEILPKMKSVEIQLNDGPRTVDIFPHGKTLRARLFPHAMSFLDEVAVWLDKRGYFEAHPVKPRFKKTKKLSVDGIEA